MTFLLIFYLLEEVLKFSQLVTAFIASTLALMLSWILLGVLFPMLWLSFEKALWSYRLGDSPVGICVQNHAEKSFTLIVRRWEIDKGLPRNLAFLFALISRLKQFFFEGLVKEMENMKNEKLILYIRSSVIQLNKGWREGTPPEILHEYMTDIKKCLEDPHIKDEKAQLEALCTVAVTQYALGDMCGGNVLGKSNWERARSLEKENESVLKWLASYGYFNSNVLRGNFAQSMELMGNQWTYHFKEKNEEERTKLKRETSGKLILNPILALPRHFILAAALNDSPVYEEEYWPNRHSYRNWKEKGSEKRPCGSEIEWIDAWYREALEVCDERFDAAGISLNFSRAYTAFYYTLLLQDVDAQTRVELVDRITDIFDSIDDHAPVPSLYVKYGFLGIFHLAYNRNPQRAFDNFQRAAKYSAISGNSFADCIFHCGHAIAAQYLSKDHNLMPYVKHYLQSAENLANEKLRGCFYPFLYEGTFAAICEIKGASGLAAEYKAKGNQGQGGKRILNIFQNNCPVK